VGSSKKETELPKKEIPSLKTKEIEKMTVSQLSTELQKRKVDFAPKSLKKVLQDLLIAANDEESNKKKEDKKDKKDKKEEKEEKEEKGEKDEDDKKTKKDNAKDDKLSKAEVEKMTVAQLNAELKKRNITAPPKAVKKVLQDLLRKNIGETGGEDEKEEEEEPKAKGGKGKRKARYYPTFIAINFFVNILFQRKRTRNACQEIEN